MKETKKTWLLPEKLTEVFLLLMMTFFPLSFSAYTVMFETKRTVFFVLCGGYAGLMLLLLAEGLIVGSYRGKQLWSRIKPEGWTQAFALAYALSAIISALLSTHRAESLLGGSRGEGALTLLIYVLCFYGVAKFARPTRWMIYLLGGVLTAFSVLCVLQLLGLNPFALYPGEYNYFDAYKAYAGAYLGTIGNVDFVAAFLCLTIPVLWIYILRGKEKKRFFLLIPLVLLLFVLVRMWVLAGVVGLFVGTLLTVPFVLLKKRSIKTAYWIGLGVLTVASVGVLYFVDFGDGFLHELHLMMHGTWKETFGSGRLYIWKNVLQRVPEHLLFGVGPDTMQYSGIEPFSRYDASLGAIYAQVDAAHNEYLNVLYHQGVLGLGCYLTALISLLLSWARSANRVIGIAMFGGAVLCYAIQAFFGISQLMVAPMFWVVMGLLDHSIQQKKKCVQ
ncbi:MAG: O-antigen ligase family protein, partial [Clostridia bacterium]|nr:O-antigen ligase family protein [Clostridia bacterium]